MILKNLMTEGTSDRRNKVVLVDMDGVIADFELGFQQAFSRTHPDLIPVPLDQRTKHYIGDDYIKYNPSITTSELVELFFQPGFFRNLPVIEGAVQAVRMLEDNYTVFICTSPLRKYKNCVLEKFEWLEEHFGVDLTSKVVLTRDKTLVRGHVLIDDNPDIKGCMNPPWRHVLFSQPYNKQDKAEFRIEGWKDMPKLMDYINALET